MKLKRTSRDEITKKIITARTWSQAVHDENISPAVRFTLAYDAARMWCEIVIRAQGLLMKSPFGHHSQTLDAVVGILGPAVEPLIRDLQYARKARNSVMYDGEIGFVTETSARALIKTLDELEEVVMSWLKENHPDLLPLL